MAFTRKNWADGYTGATPITAAELNRLEGGIIEAIQAAAEGLVPVGSVVQYAGTRIPTNWLVCNGQSISRAEYQALFSVLGTAYGSVNQQSFSLPDFRGRAPFGHNSANTLFSALGKTGGFERVALSGDQLPPHTHKLAGESVSLAWATGGMNRTSDAQIKGNTAPTGSYLGTEWPGYNTTQATGSGNTHENMPPFLTMNFIIKAR